MPIIRYVTKQQLHSWLRIELGVERHCGKWNAGSASSMSKFLDTFSTLSNIMADWLLISFIIFLCPVLIKTSAWVSTEEHALVNISMPLLFLILSLASRSSKAKRISQILYVNLNSMFGFVVYLHLNMDNSCRVTFLWHILPFWARPLRISSGKKASLLCFKPWEKGGVNPGLFNYRTHETYQLPPSLFRSVMWYFQQYFHVTAIQSMVYDVFFHIFISFDSSTLDSIRHILLLKCSTCLIHNMYAHNGLSKHRHEEVQKNEHCHNDMVNFHHSFDLLMMCNMEPYHIGCTFLEPCLTTFSSNFPSLDERLMSVGRKISSSSYQSTIQM